MLLGLCFVVIVCTVPLLGGRLTALGEVELEATWIIALAIASQIFIISVLPGGDGVLHQAVHVLSYALAGWFVWRNRRLPGLVLAAAGGLSNFLAIWANGGVMPALPSALRTAGIHQPTGEFANSTAVHGARLQALGDVFALPASWPAANVFSIGDVLVLLGAAYSLHRICGSAAFAWLRRPVGVDGFEAWRLGGPMTLLRLTASTVAGERVAALWTQDARGRRERHRVLPGPWAARTVGFAVPSSALAGAGTAALELETTFGALHPVGPPSDRPETSCSRATQPMTGAHD